MAQNPALVQFSTENANQIYQLISKQTHLGQMPSIRELSIHNIFGFNERGPSQSLTWTNSRERRP